MSHGRSLVTTAEALQRVFDASVKVPYCPVLCAGRRPFIPLKHHQFSTCASRPFKLNAPIRYSQATYTPVSTARRPFKPREVDISKFGPKDLDRPPRDQEIQAWRAHVRLPEGKLSEPKPFQDILDGRKCDEKGKFLEFVQELARADPNNDRPYPIVKYFDKLEMKEKETVKRKKSREEKLTEKGIELGWSIEGKDLEHRLARFQEFLTKGAKVEVVFGSTRIRGWSMKKKISEEEGHALLDKFKKTAMDVKGTRELGVFTGQLLGRARLTFQGPGKREREKLESQDLEG